MAEQAQYLGTGKRKTSVARVILRPGRRHDVVQRPHDRGVLPAPDAPRGRARAAEGGRRRGTLRPPRPRARRRPVRTGRRGPARHRPRARRGRPGAARSRSSARASSRATRGGRAQEGRPAQGAQGAAVLQALELSERSTRSSSQSSSDSCAPARLPPVTRRYFGTDGVRGVVGEDLTAELVERLGKAAALWSGRGRVFVGRDTRALRARARGGLRERRRVRGRQRRAGRRAADPRGRAPGARPRASSSRPPTTRPSTTASSSSTATAAS